MALGGSAVYLSYTVYPEANVSVQVRISFVLKVLHVVKVRITERLILGFGRALWSLRSRGVLGA